MKKRNHQQQCQADIRRLRSQLKVLKLFVWEILASPRVISETELNNLRQKATPILMEDPAPKQLKEMVDEGTRVPAEEVRQS
jgi:hypothetical protein